ncbi:MAG TPA: MerR family transcriptional regulator [Gaiellaceae bacterium]|nr:MerR family transcriptional regulator [Gaiellaceae bacterium]
MTVTAAGLNIAALAHATGVPAHTLRKWEQRYGVLSPVRTSGGQRRYTEVDVARVHWLRARLDEGYRIGEAAALLTAPENAPATTPADLIEAVLRSVCASDVEAAQRLLDQAFTLYPLETAIEDVAVPLLVEVGERWSAGELTVAQEHLVTSAVRARALRRLADPWPGIRGRVVLACAPGERHEVGLLALAALLAGEGWGVVYLGAETPVDAALALASSVDAVVACFSVTMEHNRDALVAGLQSSDRDGTEIVVGGQAADADLSGSVGARYEPSARAALPALGRLAL